VFETEEGTLDAIKEYMSYIPAYDPKFFRVAEPAEPRFDPEDLNRLIPINQTMVYDFEQMLARLTDNSEHMEFRPTYGPEVYTGLVKMDGFLLGIIGNKQGFLGMDYPEYAPYPGIGGKLYAKG
jgi:glutaconyl-CoA decarboxylase